MSIGRWPHSSCAASVCPRGARTRPRAVWFALVTAGLLATVIPRAAHGVMDIKDRGPVLDAGDFVMRITNIGVLGNAFFDQGFCFDPSFEYPKGSGHQCLSHAELWVGAVDGAGVMRVSGGPMLEWRPTLDPADRVLVRRAGQPGTLRGVDDDRDRRIDEEILNGRDDDNDGAIDEDLALPADEVCAADYADDYPQSVNYTYPNGEQHVPLGLDVHQEAYAWGMPGYGNLAGIEFTVTNHGTQTLRNLYLGLYCDLDSRARSDATGHLNDVMDSRSWSLVIPLPDAVMNDFSKHCADHYGGTVPVLEDGLPGSGLPVTAVVGLGHTTDPLGFLVDDSRPGVKAAREAARAPRRDSTFRYTIFVQGAPPGQGGPPTVDEERYHALEGDYPSAAHPDRRGDYAVLVSCGPFATLAPGQSLRFEVALVAAASADSIPAAIVSACFLHRGPRRVPEASGEDYADARPYIGGHEVCIEAPPGMTFQYDRDCLPKFYHADTAFKPFNPDFYIPPDKLNIVQYGSGYCIWTDADCDACTGFGAIETGLRWLAPGNLPPPPAFHASPGDHRVTIAWDNEPEIVLHSGLIDSAGYSFAGYRIYRLASWKRESEVPPDLSWALLGAFGLDTLEHQRPLAEITDTTLPPDGVEHGLRHYPIGRYRVVDDEVLNGFDYLYAVTTVVAKRIPLGTKYETELLESRIVSALDSVTVARSEARPRGDGVWVVPNPFRAHAAWDRPPVPGDPFGRHIDFMGLPRAPSIIRIYTVAGDLVARLDHDGSGGDGEMRWNLISRNGQDVESGIYLFTVDSSLGHQVGRFVVIR